MTLRKGGVYRFEYPVQPLLATQQPQPFAEGIQFLVLHRHAYDSPCPTSTATEPPITQAQSPFRNAARPPSAAIARQRSASTIVDL
jgi:hypothetical protein